MLEKDKNAQKDLPMFLAISFILTWAALAIPNWWVLSKIWNYLGGAKTIHYSFYYDLILLLIGIILAFSSPRQSGIYIKNFSKYWKRILIVCGVPIALTILIYPNLNEKPFSGMHWSMWAISPLAQDLIFMGFIFGILDRFFKSKKSSSWIPGKTLIIGGLFFALYHIPNLAEGISLSYVIFQIAYTFIGFIITGLPRQWTGSILFTTITHSIINYIACIT